MTGGVEIEPVGIAGKHGAHLWRKIGLKARFDVFANAQELNQIGGARFAFVPGQHLRPERGPQRLLDRGEVVLGMGPGDAEGGIRIGAPDHPGHAIGVARDLHIIGFSGGDGGGRVKAAPMQRGQAQTGDEQPGDDQPKRAKARSDPEGALHGGLLCRTECYSAAMAAPASPGVQL